MGYGRTKIKNLESVVAENKAKITRIESKNKSNSYVRPAEGLASFAEKTKVVFGLHTTIIRDERNGVYSAFLTDYPSVKAQASNEWDLGTALSAAHAAALEHFQFHT